VVRLEILPEDTGTDGPVKQISLVRNKIKLEDQAAKQFVVDDLEGTGKGRIGVIDVPTFYRDFSGYSEGDDDFRSTTRDVRGLLRELRQEGVDGIVIDLRGNGGGSLAEATELTGLFIPSGPVVQVKSSSGDIELEMDPDPNQVYDGPLAVLVDRHSASASEIFAGAIQDYGRGIIIGEPTFGKGTVQTLLDLDRFVNQPDGKLGRLRLTMAQFFRVNGGSTQFRGVVPNIVFPTASGSEEEGERSLDNALPWARINAADYRSHKLGSLEPYRKAHESRVASDAGFLFLSDEQARLKEIREQETVSLNQKRRKQEWDEQESTRKAQKQRFRAAVGLPPKVDEEEKKKHGDERDEEQERMDRIGLNEAARILADYIAGLQPRSAMVQ
jgi:carboxyl-terminal processing protease